MIREIEDQIGQAVIGNVVASGTAVIEEFSPARLATGRPIVYTSADSVFQVAAHEDVFSVEKFQRLCQRVFTVACLKYGIGRVIARPFVGTPGAFVRSAGRHDFALEPPVDTLLDLLARADIPVATIGKIAELFAHRGVSRGCPTVTDADGLARLRQCLGEEPQGVLFVNLVDSDFRFGHRNDPVGFAADLEQIDEGLGRVLAQLSPSDLLIITADHGNDPTMSGTDHTREFVPLLMVGSRVREDTDLGTRTTFADLGQTVAHNFGVGQLPHGTSVLEIICGNDS